MPCVDDLVVIVIYCDSIFISPQYYAWYKWFILEQRYTREPCSAHWNGPWMIRTAASHHGFYVFIYGDGSFYAFSGMLSMHTLEHDAAPANDGRPELFKPYPDKIICSWLPINTHLWPSVWCEHSLITEGWCKWSQAAHLVLYMDPLEPVSLCLFSTKINDIV